MPVILQQKILSSSPLSSGDASDAGKQWIYGDNEKILLRWEPSVFPTTVAP